MNLEKDLSNLLKSHEIRKCTYSCKQFNELLKQERLRSDRSNHIFTLLLFNIGIQKKNTPLIRNLSEILASRVRFSDDVGFFDDHKIAVLLPDTSTQGARMLADKLSKEIGIYVPSLQYEMYTYPPCTYYWDEVQVDSLLSPEEIHVKVSDGYSMPFWKRAMDIFVSFTGLFLLAPLFILIAIVIKIVAPGTVFFSQKRVGHRGKIFNVFKFRTMKVNSSAHIHHHYLKGLINGDSNGDKPMEKLDMDNDPRIIPFGKFIRVSSLDELPQLINVLRGEMSLVGPRPCIPYETDEYLLWHSRRFDITPGISGLWQVSGKNELTFKEMIRLDIKYAAQRSFCLDIQILLKTLFVVLSPIRECLIKNRKKDYLKKKVENRCNRNCQFSMKSSGNKSFM
ncbi:MAG TPA: sugar transferase [Anaerolineae bacterium]|nr:sugar transferase [Anaerolineae bacterium]